MKNLRTMNELSTVLEQAAIEIDAVTDTHTLVQIKARYLGKSGRLTELLKALRQLAPEERPQAGQAINQAKQQVMDWLNRKQEQLKEQELITKLATERIDVTMPGKGQEVGTLHPVTQTRQRLEKYFQQLGFELSNGPEIEHEYYNFSALNIPEYHPARTMHDTFYVTDEHLLRTHTSPVQIRVMQNRQPPLRIIATGRVYRCDSDVTHTPMFHQAEGFWIEEGVTFAQLKQLLHDFVQYFFARPLAMRMRPSYFPFTEPSAEVDIQCVLCDGSGCRLCGHTGWLEILGCGMVHPNVLKAGGIDPAHYTGLAFGIGLDRLTMLRHGIDDLRLLFANDLRLLKQFQSAQAQN